MRQFAPVAILVGIVISFAAFAASALEVTREPWYHSGFNDVDLHGAPVVGRAFAALGIGLLLGAALGRTLPAFIVGTLLALVLYSIIGTVRAGWLDAQAGVIPGVSGDQVGTWAGLTYGTVWIAPDGSQLEDSEAFALVPASESDGNAWLHGRGYRSAIVGVSEAAAMGWAAYDVLICGIVGVTSLTLGIVVVNRRRPT